MQPEDHNVTTPKEIEMNPVLRLLSEPRAAKTSLGEALDERDKKSLPPGSWPR